MKNSMLAAFIISAIMSAACVPSLHPFFNEADLVFDKRLIGKWSDHGHTESWTFERRGEKKYRMTYTDESGESGLYEAALFTLDGRMFLDLVPVRKRDVHGGHLVAFHTVLGMTLEDDERAKLFYIDQVWLKNFLEANPGRVKNNSLDQGIVLTDTTSSLQSLMRLVMVTPGALDESEAITKQRVDP